MDESDDEVNPFGELSKLEPDAETAQKAISRVRASLVQQAKPRRRNPWIWRIAAGTAACFIAGFAWWVSLTISMIDSRRPQSPSEEALLDPELKPEVGIGPLKFGTTQEEAVRALGKPDRVDSETNAMDYFSRGYSIRFDRLARFHEIDCYTHEARDVKVGDFTGHTAEGIRMGASRAAIEKAYGAPESENNSADSLVLAYPSRGMEFTLKDDRLVRIVIWN